MASASENYAVAAELMMRSNVPSMFTQMFEGFEKMDRMLRASVEGFDRMAAGAKRAADAIARAQTDGAERGARAQEAAANRASRATQGAADRTAMAQERASRASMAAATRATQARERNEEREAARYNAVRDAAEREDYVRDQRARNRMDAARDAAEREDFRRGAAGRQPAAREPTRVSAMDVSMAAGGVAGVLGGLITTSARASLEPAYILDMLKRDNRVSAADVKGADDAAWSATRSAPGTTYGKNLEAVVDLKNVTGSLSDAVKILPQFANLSAILAIADKKAGGSGDQAFAAAKAMEVLGQLTVERRNPQTGKLEQYIDPAQLPARLERMAKVSVATMGRVNPTDYLSFAKTARAGGMNLSDEFLYEKLPAMMMVMGASRAGTAVQSMAQVFSGGKLTNKSLGEMADLGLAGTAKMETTGKGANKRTRMTGKVFEQDLLSSDPAAWAAKVHDHLINDLHMSESDAMSSVQKMAQRSTIAGMLADLMKDGAGILKEQQNIQHTDVNGIAASNPEGKINALHASFENLMAALGGPLVGPATAMMDNLSAALNHVGDWAKANPTEAKILGEVAVGLFGLASAVAAVSVALMIYGPIIAAARGLVAGRAALTAGVAVAEGAAGASGVAGVVGASAAAGAAGAAVVAVAAGVAAAIVIKGITKPTHVADMVAQDQEKARRSPRTISAFGEPVDGVTGIPSAAPAHSDLPVKTIPSGTQDVRVVNAGDIARGATAFIASKISRPPSGPTGFDPTGSVASHPSTSTP